MAEINETRQGLVIDDAQADPRWRGTAGDQTRSVIVVPMFGRFKLLGLLILTHEQTKYFNLEHQLLLQAIASQAAIAIENAQLYASMAQEQQRLSAVLQGAADAILMFDANDCLALINPAGERLFADAQIKIGKPLSRGNGYDAFLALLGETHNTGAQQTGEIVWPDKRVFSVVITSSGEAGCVVLLHDVSHFKALERVKDEFISAASHDLKSPITTITGFSQLLMTAGPLNENQTQFVQHIHTAAQNMGELVQDLLDLAKFDMGVEMKFEEVDLLSLVTEVTNEFAAQAATMKQKLTVGSVPGHLALQGVPSQLKQALRNLVGNAVKYTPEGGSIDVFAEPQGNTIRLFVKDTGRGIPADDLPFIFDRFYRASSDDAKEIEGNGLGLAIARAVAERHGGKISVESEPGKGSCFIFSLPLMQPETPSGSNPRQNS